MKRLLHLLIILSLFIWVACEDEKSSNEDDTLHDFELHSNNRVSSLLMSDSEYSDWVSNDGFTDNSMRIPLINDVYNKFPDEYDFIFFCIKRTINTSKFILLWYAYWSVE